MGASVDWSREAFTLDETREKAVHTAFKQMYADDLIYRKEKVINWDPKGQTVISDDEIIYETRKRVCDECALRSPYKKDDDTIGYRCASEPVEDYVRK
jgi:valyl-tRNA synthetase